MPTGFVTEQDTCPGAIDIHGFGNVEVVAATWNVPDEAAGKVTVKDGKIVPRYKSRGYFAGACELGKYNSSDYSTIPLLGKAFTFTTNLAEAGCGCNVAMYLTSLHQNQDISGCKDYYCDANVVCGVACHEIDIMEANAHAFRSSLHTEDDRWGKSIGLGGEATDWTSHDYGPNGTCINTSFPFEVVASFPMENGELSSVIITASQEYGATGQRCNLTLTLAGYDGNTTISKEGSGHGMRALQEALRAGMTPIVSLWGADDMSWMDGEGSRKTGPCKSDSEYNCPEEVRMYHFTLEDLPPAPPKGLFWILGLVLVVVLTGGAVVLVKFMMMTEGDASHEELVEDDDSSS